MDLKIVEDNMMVGICCSNGNGTLDSFIDLYVDDPFTPSLFKSKKEARMFAEILIKLIGSIME